MNTLKIEHGIRTDYSMWVSITGPMPDMHSQFDFGGHLEQLLTIIDSQREIESQKHRIRTLEDACAAALSVFKQGSNQPDTARDMVVMLTKALKGEVK